MLRLLILTSLCAVITASLISNYHLEYPRGLQRLFSAKQESVVEEKKNEREVCNTEECKLIAQVIKDSMDESVDPCDNFYEYACGKWSNINPVPENMTEWSLWEMVSKKIEKQIEGIITSETKPDDLFALKLAKKWYRSCTDTDSIERRGAEPILSTLWRHGGWPLIMEDGEWDEDVYNWQIVDDQFARLLGFNAFHDLRYDSLSYEDNETILIETPHLPIGAHQLLSIDILSLFDSSDENNESGEGSQEKGSRERGPKPHGENDDEDEENSGEDDDEDEDEDDWSTEEGSEDWDTAESEEKLRKKKVAAKRHHRKLSHVRRRQSRKKGSRHVRVDEEGTRKRSKRDVMKQTILHRILRRLNKINKHKVHHSASRKLSDHGHLSRNKQSKRRNDMESKVAKKHSNKKKVSENDENEEELRKKKTGERKVSKQLGHSKKKNNKSKVLRKHDHERKMKKKSRRTGMEAKVHTAEHRKNQKVANHRVHHSASKLSVSKRRKMSSSDGGDDADNELDTSNDDEYDDSDNENDYDSDEGTEETNGEKDNDENDGNDEDEENEDSDEGIQETDEETDDDEDSDDEEDDDEDSDNDDNDGDYDGDDDDEEDEEKLQELREQYRDYILNVSIILSEERGIEIPREKMKEDASDLVDFIVTIGELLLLVDDDETMNTTLDEFNRYYESLTPLTRRGKVNWIRKVQKVFSEAGVEIDDDVEIVVTCPEYIELLQSLLDITPAKVLVNYIHWSFISKAIMAGPEKLRSLSDNWTMMPTFGSRESLCLELVQLTNVAGYEYVKRYFSEDVAKSARDMIDDIQKEVEYQIKASTWMNEDTKHFVLDKLVHMENWVGYPDWYQNITIVKRYFQGLTIGTSFYENILNYIRHLKWKSLRRIVSNEEINDMLNPLELNAFFIPTENSISITAVDFQSPFFAHNRPWYVNFGIIGYIMAHEVNHGFDDSGHLYDKEGNEMEWLTAMAEAYNKRAKCFVDQYNNYSILKGENYTIEDYGNQTAGENIADTMGLHTVYRAYKRRERECGKMDPALPGLEKYTNDQAFFLSFANLWCEAEEDRESTIASAKYDVHSTGRLRVIGPASNLKEFSEAFNCPVGSPMNPKRKCNIWK